MTVAKEVSPEAVVIATLEIAYSILRHLVQREIMTEAEVAKLLSAAAKSQREVGAVLPANEEAATANGDNSCGCFGIQSETADVTAHRASKYKARQVGGLKEFCRGRF